MKKHFNKRNEALFQRLMEKQGIKEVGFLRKMADKASSAMGMDVTSGGVEKDIADDMFAYGRLELQKEMSRKLLMSVAQDGHAHNILSKIATLHDSGLWSDDQKTMSQYAFGVPTVADVEKILDAGLDNNTEQQVLFALLNDEMRNLDAITFEQFMGDEKTRKNERLNLRRALAAGGGDQLDLVKRLVDISLKDMETKGEEGAVADYSKGVEQRFSKIDMTAVQNAIDKAFDKLPGTRDPQDVNGILHKILGTFGGR